MIRVLIVDDSAVVRETLTKELSKFSDIEVVGTAVDPYVARDKIVACKPDIMTLDLEMPRMDGLSFLSKVMKHSPMPVIVVSSVAQANSEAALRALSLGAVSVVPKPNSQYSVPDVGKELVRALRAGVTAKLKTQDELATDNVSFTGLATTDKVIAIGASTGGTVAVESVLRRIPQNSPGILIAQHMPAGFTGPFAEQLNKTCALEVREAKNGDRVLPGLALVAPAGVHMLLRTSGAQWVIETKSGPPVHYQKPSVDVLFQSVARSAGPNAVGVLLTGMGEDGAQGLLAMRRAGAPTICQDEASCVVYGMPKKAVEIDAADKVAPLDNIPDKIRAALATPAGARG